MADVRPTILVLLGCFSGRSDASGPNLSMTGSSAALAGAFNFLVVGDSAGRDEPLQWRESGRLQRLELPHDRRLPGRLRKLLLETPHDLLICNGFFDRWLTIPTLMMRRFGLIRPVPTLVAPRGEFSPGALAIKRGRKIAYLRLVDALGLLKGVHLQATDELERDAIARALPGPPSILIGPNVRRLRDCPSHPARKPGEPLRVAFLSRIDRKKNLDLALEWLGKSGVEASFDIIGPVSDTSYWDRCQALIAGLPARIQTDYRGEIPPDQVLTVIAGYDLLLLPTAGENYGHAIVDSMEAGTPVMISDRTPWRGLEQRRAGLALPLEDEAGWIAALRRFAAMDDAEMRQWRSGARHFAEAVIDPERQAAALERCYLQALGAPR